MELFVTRRTLTEQSSIGEATFEDGSHLCFTLEPKTRREDEPKVFGKTAIPLGRYELIINHSPKFDVDMPLLLDVPNFKGVRWHWGNFPADTEGCTVVGNFVANVPDEVLHSREAYAKVTQAFLKLREGGERIFVTYRLAPGVTPL